jgi:hypothetical protein
LTHAFAYETAYSDTPEYHRQLKIGAESLRQIWSLAVEATTLTTNRTLLLTAVGAMMDTAATRTLSLGTHVPRIVILFLIGIVLTGSMLIGAMLGGLDSRHWFERIIVAAVLSVIVYAIMDMEYPRLGTLLLQREDTMLVDLRETMN